VGLSALQAVAQLAGAVVAAYAVDGGVTVAVVSAACTAVVAVPYVKVGGRRPLDAAVRSDFLRVGLPYLPTAISLTLLAVGDRFIVAHRLGEEQAALYAAVFSLMFRPFNLFTQVAHTVVVPEASRRANQATLGDGEAHWRRSAVPVVALAAVGAVVLYAFHDVVLLLLDPPYRHPPRSLLLGAIGAGVAYLTYSILSVRAVLRKMVGVNAVAVAFVAVAWVVVNLVMVHDEDDIALPAVSLVVAYLAAAAVSAVLVRRRSPTLVRS
jgi:O-antigen/teichoic acid export membrane protein